MFAKINPNVCVQRTWNLVFKYIYESFVHLMLVFNIGRFSVLLLYHLDTGVMIVIPVKCEAGIVIRCRRASRTPFLKVVIIGVLQIQILVIFSLTSGYQPILTKFSANVAYFSKLNLPFLPKITNELISDI